jgi:hypothetical protein
MTREAQMTINNARSANDHFMARQAQMTINDGRRPNDNYFRGDFGSFDIS